MFPFRSLDKIVFILFLCVLNCYLQSEGKPLRKRSVSEVQLMHNLGEYKHEQERQDWLQMKLKDIHTASLRKALRGERVGKSLDVREFSPDEVEYIVKKLLNSP